MVPMLCGLNMCFVHVWVLCGLPCVPCVSTCIIRIMELLSRGNRLCRACSIICLCFSSTLGTRWDHFSQDISEQCWRNHDSWVNEVTTVPQQMMADFCWFISYSTSWTSSWSHNRLPLLTHQSWLSHGGVISYSLCILLKPFNSPEMPPFPAPSWSHENGLLVVNKELNATFIGHLSILASQKLNNLKHCPTFHPTYEILSSSEFCNPLAILPSFPGAPNLLHRTHSSAHLKNFLQFASFKK